MWPFKRNDSSPASFEKALSRLSEQITRSTIRLDSHRTRSRRVKALWTLYTSIGYLIYTLILALVLGAKNWNVAHYGGLLGAPVTIYGVRKGVSLFYEWRISKEQAYLEDLQNQRDKTIDRLKAATKYNSTQQLLEKYGGSTPKSTPSGKGRQGSSQKGNNTPSSGGKKPQPLQLPVGRTGIAPPPTANIPGRSPQNANLPATPARPSSSSTQPAGSSPGNNIPFSPDEPGFAPNAFSAQPPPSLPSSQQYQAQARPHWYDRLMDLLLGEDETLPKNRLALICSNCRLVNGQAPPGVKTLDEVGKWRCGSCGSWNGEESEAKKMLEAIRKKEERDRKEGWEVVSRGEEQGTGKDEEPVVQRTGKKDVIPSSEDEGEEFLEAASTEENPDDHDDEGVEDHEPSTARKRVTRSTGKHDKDLIDL